MARTISSIPGSNKFRSIVSIGIIVTCIAVYLVLIEDISVQADRVARDQVITSIRGSLAMLIYDYSIKGKLQDLAQFDGENPFVPLAIYRSLPSNYHGVIKSLEMDREPGWYFDLKERLVVFVSLEDRVQRYRMVFEYEDVNGDGDFNFQIDIVTRLDIEEVAGTGNS